jgi:hypothetical protein
MSRKLALAFFATVFALEGASSSQGRSVHVTFVATIDLGSGSSVSAFRNLAFVSQSGNASGGGSIAIVDISNPANPVKLGETTRYPATGAGESRAIRIGRRVVLAVALSGVGVSTPASPKGLKLFDISDAAQPVELGFYDPGPGQIVPGSTFSGASSLDIAVTRNGRTLALLATQGTEVVSSNSGLQAGVGDLQIVDITDPTRPTLVGEWGVLDEPTMGAGFLLSEQRGARADAFIERVQASRNGEQAYLAYSDHGAMILDISNPSQPVLVGHVGLFEANEEGAAFDVHPARGGRTLIRSHLVRSNFQIELSSSAYSGARTAGEAGNTPAIYSMPGNSIAGDVVFVGRGCPGDAHLADPNGKLALMTIVGCTANLKTAGAQLAGAIGVILYDDGPALTIAGFDAQFPPGAGGIAILPDGTSVTIAIPVMGVGQNTGRCLAQARNPSGSLLAVNCSPASPVAVHATALFHGFGRLDIFDVRNPADPVKVSTFGTPNSLDLDFALMNRFPNPNPTRFLTANHIDVAGGLLFAAWELDGLRVIDISRPRFPQEVALWNGEGRPPGAPPVQVWQLVRHRDLILLGSLFEGAVHILRVEPAALFAEAEDEPD